jgi:hypothetical protein
MLTHPEEVSDRLGRLLDAVQKLFTVSGLGFLDDRARKVNEALQDASRRDRWALVDLRGLEGEAAIEALRAQIEAPTLVAVIEAEKPALPVVQLASAFVDDKSEVDLGNRRPVKRRDRQNLVVVCEGASELRQVPRELQRIAYWDFIP